MRTGAAIEAVGLTKEYRSRGRTVRAVDGLNLSVGAGESRRPSGLRKTT